MSASPAYKRLNDLCTQTQATLASVHDHTWKPRRGNPRCGGSIGAIIQSVPHLSFCKKEGFSFLGWGF